MSARIVVLYSSVDDIVRIPAVTEAGAGMRSTTGRVSVTPAGRGRDVTQTSMSVLTSPVVTEEHVRTGLVSSPVTVSQDTMEISVSWMLTSVTGTKLITTFLFSLNTFYPIL